MRRRKWIKRSLLALAAVLTAAAALSYWAFKGTPEYYRRPELTAAERAAAADRAEKKFIRTREWANDLWVREQRSILAAGGGGSGVGVGATTQAATTTTGNPLSIGFTEQELNAFCQKWSHTWDKRYRDMLKDPVIILRDDRIILAASVTDIGAVASFHFYPRFDADGQLLFTLESVRAGRLSLPEVVWAAQRDRVVKGLRRRLPGWQRGATIGANGVANRDAVAAHMSKLLFDMLAGRPREPVLFIPFEEDGRAVPVRLTAVRVVDGELTLAVESMTPAERAALLEDIREPVPAITASAQ